MALFEQEMDATGVSHAVVVGQRADPAYGSADNADIANLVRVGDGRYTGFAGLDASDSDVLDQLDEAAASGCDGVALVTGWSRHPHHEDDPLLEPLLAECEQRQLPVVFTSSHYIGPDLTWADPRHLQRVAMRHPRLTVIVGHACWPFTTAACALAMRCTNVYLMPEFYAYLPAMPGSRDYVDAANGYLATRMLYSSCYPSRSLSQAREEFESLPLSAVSRRRVMRENAERLLGR
jgi:predicted TIM-barrel fold metal-dependent hydrolase